MMASDTKTLHQQLMDEAYGEWQAQEGLDYDEFVDDLDKRSRAAVILGNFNYQVENGGFSQWDFNGYSSQVKRLLRYLEAMSTTTAQEAAKLVQEFQEIKDSLNYEDDSYLDDEDEAIAFPFNHLDSRYYEINDQLMDDIEAWLATI